MKLDERFELVGHLIDDLAETRFGKVRTIAHQVILKVQVIRRHEISLGGHAGHKNNRRHQSRKTNHEFPSSLSIGATPRLLQKTLNQY